MCHGQGGRFVICPEALAGVLRRPSRHESVRDNENPD